MLAERLKALRKEKKITQSQVATAVGVKRAAISKYESGAITPSNEVMRKLSQYFGVSSSYLYGDIDTPYPAGFKFKTIGKNLIEFMDEKNISIEELVSQSGLSEDDIRCLIEGDITDNFTMLEYMSCISHIAKALDTDTGFLLFGKFDVDSDAVDFSWWGGEDGAVHLTPDEASESKRGLLERGKDELTDELMIVFKRLSKDQQNQLIEYAEFLTERKPPDGDPNE